ncbi:MAG: BACON domain-containing protein [Acidobacteria bacterium]|nr:BACON domain-containing protein [Acidobacteriota bacterium]
MLDISAASAAIIKIISPQQISPGGLATISATAWNPGGAAVENVTGELQVGPNLTVQNSLVQNIGTLGPGEQRQLTWQVKALSVVSSVAESLRVRTSTTTIAAVLQPMAGVIVISATTLSVNTINVGASGGSGSIVVSPAPTGALVVSASDPWITFSVSGATVSYLVSANAGASGRTGSLMIDGQIVTVTQAGTQATAGLRLVPVSPCRLVETRAAYAGTTWSGSFGPPILTAGATRTIPVTASPRCGIPPSAKAFVLNVTLDTVEGNSGPVDFVTLWPAGEARPEHFTLRTTTGGYIANAAIVKAGTGGAISVYASNSVHLIVDISGYFTDDANVSGLLYYPMTPCRAVDTRGPIYSSLPAPYGNQRMQAREARTFRLPGSPACQIPVAAAYSMQLTLAPGELTNGNPVAFITAYPTGTSQPNISNMNAVHGYAVANSAIVPASGNGSIDVYAYDATNLIMDVTGYFAADDGTGGGLYYYPVTQCRVVNTQDSTFTGAFGPPALSASTDRTVPVSSGRCALSDAARAWVLNASVTPSGNPMPFLSMWPTGSPWPNVSQLNAFQGQTIANMGIVPASANGSVNLKVAGGTHAIIEVSGYFGR